MVRERLNIETKLTDVESSLSKATAYETKQVEDAMQYQENKMLDIIKSFHP